jgi:hypothetical protein
MPSLARCTPSRMPDRPSPFPPQFPFPQIPPKPQVHFGCRLPINLRAFLAQQLGCRAEADDETILNCAAKADQATLNRLARAIRRYSTARAREAWTECNVDLAKFAEAECDGHAVLLCLKCGRVEFGEGGLRDHQRAGCVPITLVRGSLSEPAEASPAQPAGDEVAGEPSSPLALIADSVQRLVEEFRALRAAFGLPHFDLDCYVRGTQLTLMWRPLP